LIMATPDRNDIVVPLWKPPAGRTLRWLFLGFSLSLLGLLCVAGVCATPFLTRLHAQEMKASQLLAERSETLTSCRCLSGITIRQSHSL
jgi:hypothetical protein